MTTAQKINNEIAESYCSFEVSKLLKEKGFDVKGFWSRDKENNLWEHNGRTSNNFDKYFLAPTHDLAIEWIRVNFGVHIYIKILINVSEYVHRKVFSPAILEDTDAKMGFTTFDSPQEATDAALLYTLKNLIP